MYIFLFLFFGIFLIIMGIVFILFDFDDGKVIKGVLSCAIFCIAGILCILSAGIAINFELSKPKSLDKMNIKEIVQYTSELNNKTEALDKFFIDNKDFIKLEIKNLKEGENK